MADAMTLESINREQLVTATDRLLVLGARALVRRFARGTQVRLPTVQAVPDLGAARTHAPPALSRLGRAPHFVGYPRHARIARPRRTVAPAMVGIALRLATRR